MLDRRKFLNLLAGSAAAPLAAQRRGRKPNFVVVLADDLGYSDAGCYGGDIDTPHLDRLASRGIRFTQGYSTARCGPSRSCLLAGYYAQQTACDVMTPGRTPVWTQFLTEYLKPLGYRSYHSGKWHIKFRPLTGAGFDHSYTLLDENRYFTPRQHAMDEEALPGITPADGFYVTTSIAEHAIRFLKRHAADHASDPFFLYLAFTSPHFPLHALREDIERYKDRFADGWDGARELRLQRMRRMGIVNCGLAPLEPEIRPPWNTPEKELIEKIGPGEVVRAVPWSTLTPEQKKLQRTKMAIHAAMITRMDHEIGRVIDQLRVMEALRETVILFLSDNGASAEQIIRGDGHDPAAPAGSASSYLCLGPGWASAANTPFRLHKSWVHEGGIASPFIVHWPAGIADPGKLRHDPCHFIDVLPTIIDLAGGSIDRLKPAGGPPLPGRSIAPALTGHKALQRDYLYFSHSNNRAIRAGDWKLVATGQSGPWELYNLAPDRCEQNNLASHEPDRVRRMAALWKERDDEHVRVREASAPTDRPLQYRSR
ncbi:MAG TPA: arylsulfatase [Bryobacteraceae bacterium]|nr:arylsulfatase [Bryobacteraceae bacterium]